METGNIDKWADCHIKRYKINDSQFIFICQTFSLKLTEHRDQNNPPVQKGKNGIDIISSILLPEVHPNIDRLESNQNKEKYPLKLAHSKGKPWSWFIGTSKPSENALSSAGDELGNPSLKSSSSRASKCVEMIVDVLPSVESIGIMKSVHIINSTIYFSFYIHRFIEGNQFAAQL